MADEGKPASNERMTYFRRKAAEARDNAKSAPTAEIHSRHLALAESYDRLAAEVASERPKE